MGPPSQPFTTASSNHSWAEYVPLLYEYSVIQPTVRRERPARKLWQQNSSLRARTDALYVGLLPCIARYHLNSKQAAHGQYKLHVAAFRLVGGEIRVNTHTGASGPGSAARRALASA